MSTKADLHRLVNELPDTELLPAARFLEYLRDFHADPVLRAMRNAPDDDEPLSPPEAAAADEAWAAYRRGAFISADEAKREIQPLLEYK